MWLGAKVLVVCQQLKLHVCCYGVSGVVQSRIRRAQKRQELWPLSFLKTS